MIYFLNENLTLSSLFSESFSLLGTIYGVLGSLSLALFTIQTKKALPFVENHIWLLSYYNNIYSCFLFLPLFLFTNDLSFLMRNPHLADAQFWLLLCLGGACGFSIGYATALQIKVKSRFICYFQIVTEKFLMDHVIL